MLLKIYINAWVAIFDPVLEQFTPNWTNMGFFTIIFCIKSTFVIFGANLTQFHAISGDPVSGSL